MRGKSVPREKNQKQVREDAKREKREAKKKSLPLWENAGEARSGVKKTGKG